MANVATILVALLLVPCGRWMYFHPQALVPKWYGELLSQSGLKAVIDLARFLGILVVFVAIGAATANLGELTGMGFLFIGLLQIPLAVVGTWAIFRQEFRDWRKQRAK